MRNSKNVFERIGDWIDSHSRTIAICVIVAMIGFMIATCVSLVISAVTVQKNENEKDLLPTPIPTLAETTAEEEMTDVVTDDVTEETTIEPAKVVVVNEWYDGETLYASNNYDVLEDGLVDQIILEWDSSGYDCIWGEEVEYEIEYDTLYSVFEINLYFEKRVTYSTADASYLDGEWCYINEPSQVNSLYEGVFCITDTSSAQYAWLCSHDYYYDAEGIGMYDGRVMVALTPAFGGIGDYVDLLLADGSILPCVICDHKGNAGTWGHWHGDCLNVIEIMVADWWYDGHENKWYPDVVAFR